MQSSVVVGIDIGGTKTHLRVAPGSTVPASDHIIPTMEWRHNGNIADAGALLGLVGQLCGDHACIGLAVGAHGCDSADDCYAFEQELRLRADFPVQVVNDAELFVPASHLESGIGLVAGTGSIAVGRRADNTMLVAGGWGWILGDEGSAAGLVREAVRAVRGAIDSAQPRDQLFEALCSSLDVRSETEFGRKLDAVRGAASWGSHAQAVFNAAASGSALALNVIREGARALALLVRRVAERGSVSRRVVAAGGVIVAQSLLYQLFEQELALAVPDAVPVLLRNAPVAGAVVLAERLAFAQPSLPVRAGAR